MTPKNVQSDKMSEIQQQAQAEEKEVFEKQEYFSYNISELDSKLEAIPSIKKVGTSLLYGQYLKINYKGVDSLPTDFIPQIYIEITGSYENYNEIHAKVAPFLIELFNILGEQYDSQQFLSNLKDPKILQMNEFSSFLVAISNNNAKENNIQLILTPKKK
ncbi:MAG: hypothetical protein GX180_05395 [Enterococcus sp.]|nr:hypothetical protein [Enterococcus sp.]